MTTLVIFLSYLVLGMLFAHWQISISLRKSRDLKLTNMGYSEYKIKFWVSTIAYPFLLVGILYNLIKKWKK